MLEINCFTRNRAGKVLEKWTGSVTFFKSYGSHYEMRINSRSSILVLFGRYTGGWFANIPDWNAGCYLGDLKDVFYNTEKLTGCMKNKIDAITVARALDAIANTIYELEGLKWGVRSGQG